MGEFDSAVVVRRLQLMQERLQFLAALGAPSGDDLEADLGVRIQVERIISQLVDLAVDINSHISATRLNRIPGDARASFTLAATSGAINQELATALRGAVGLRNVIVHEYTELDLSILADAVAIAQEQFGAYLQHVAAFALSRNADG